jgi:ribokinase
MIHMLDILSIGDSTVDVFLELDEASVQCDLDTENCRLCVNYADKIPVRTMHRVNAVGNAANHAVAASRLGLDAALATIVGGDDTGSAIVKQLKKEGVNTRYVEVDKKHGSNYSTVIGYKGERTILVYHEPRTYRWNGYAKARWVYFTSMGEGSESLHPELISYLKRTGAKLAMNPGTYQLRADGKTLAPVLAETDVLFVNKEEAKRILHEDALNDIGALLERLHALGPKICVITDGQKGSYGYDGSAKYFMKIFEAPVVERTGSGDAYASGFVAALAYGLDFLEAMRWGSVNAAGVVQHIGAQEGLSNKSDILTQLSANSDYRPEPFTV